MESFWSEESIQDLLLDEIFGLLAQALYFEVGKQTFTLLEVSTSYSGNAVALQAMKSGLDEIEKRSIYAIIGPITGYSV